jgi:hypothetical protein
MKVDVTMTPAAIRNFLTLPGIAGVTLMDGQSPLYFCRPDCTLPPPQQTVLFHGIVEILETIAAEFVTFEFHLPGYKAMLHQIDYCTRLLVLTDPSLGAALYNPALLEFEKALKDCRSETLAALPDIARSLGFIDATVTVADIAPTARPNASAATTTITLQEMLLAINHLSRFATQYLGNSVIANQLQQARPNSPWLDQFEIGKKAQITFVGGTDQLSRYLTSDEYQQLCLWSSVFITRCSRVIRDFGKLVERQGLDESTKSLLLR